ncbi:translation initiation factor IF-2 [Alphaproteobacteria bacterium]|nr:translation initiation factor IF-2 [Alphaproteobacteria bacterium]
MKIRVNWIIDGTLEIEADNVVEAEQIVADKLQHFIQSHPELTNELGATAIQGQAIDENGEPLSRSDIN